MCRLAGQCRAAPAGAAGPAGSRPRWGRGAGGRPWRSSLGHRRSARTTAEVIKFALWPLAVMTVLNRVFIKAVNGFITDDFKPVYNASLAFLNHRPVYTANYDLVDPHYLYPPSGTLLIAPLALI